MKSLKQVLIDARALITPEANWTQQCNARNKFASPVPPSYPTAVRWCVHGALLHEGLDNSFHQLPLRELGRYNDTHTHAEVLAFLHEMINQI